MHGTEARWNMDYLLSSHAASCTPNEHATELMNRLKDAYRLTREHLGSVAVYSKGWYDKKVTQQNFEVGERIRLLDQRGHTKRTPKWQLPYRQIESVVRKLSEVTYVIRAPGWREPRILHVDKLRRLEALNGLVQSELREPVPEVTPQPVDSRTRDSSQATGHDNTAGEPVPTRRGNLLPGVGPEDVSSQHGACLLAR